MALKQDGVHLVLCPGQGMYFTIFFCPKHGQGFKLSAAHLYPSIGRVTPYPLPPLSRSSHKASAAQDVCAYTI